MAYIESNVYGHHFYRVSSTLDKSTSRKGLTDRDSGTCWTSTAGLPQWIQLSFTEAVQPQILFLTFQGGFVGTRVAVSTAPASNASSKSEGIPESKSNNPEWTLLKYVYPEDVNKRQSFDLKASDSDSSASSAQQDTAADTPSGITQIKLVFEQSSDFFGRITIYDLDVHG
jgi:hypothetical protein